MTAKTQFDWKVTRFELSIGTRHVDIELRNPALNGWAVIDGRLRLNKNGDWSFEPLPSSRTDEWIEAHTFYSLDKARKAAEEAIQDEN